MEKPYIGMGFKLGSKPVDGLALNFGMDAFMNVGKDSKVAFDLVFDASYKWVKWDFTMVTNCSTMQEKTRTVKI